MARSSKRADVWKDWRQPHSLSATKVDWCNYVMKSGIPVSVFPSSLWRFSTHIVQKIIQILIVRRITCAKVKVAYLTSFVSSVGTVRQQRVPCIIQVLNRVGEDADWAVSVVPGGKGV